MDEADWRGGEVGEGRGVVVEVVACPPLGAPQWRVESYYETGPWLLVCAAYYYLRLHTDGQQVLRHLAGQSQAESHTLRVWGYTLPSTRGCAALPKFTRVRVHAQSVSVSDEGLGCM